MSSVLDFEIQRLKLGRAKLGEVVQKWINADAGIHRSRENSLNVAINSLAELRSSHLCDAVIDALRLQGGVTPIVIEELLSLREEDGPLTSLEKMLLSRKSVRLSEQIFRAADIVYPRLAEIYLAETSEDVAI